MWGGVGAFYPKKNIEVLSRDVRWFVTGNRMGKQSLM